MRSRRILQVNEFFHYHTDIDLVVHAAVKGGPRGTLDTTSNYIENTKMFLNLKNNSDKFGMMIHFGSGAEFDREQEIDQMREQEIFLRQPKDYYGKVKNNITREIIKLDSNIYNMRLFGCFGASETDNRLIKNCINKISSGRPIVIHQDKMMDYFYVEDLFTVIDYYINNEKKIISKETS